MINRPILSSVALNLGVALFIMAAYNATFWQRNVSLFDGHWPVVLTFGAAVTALTMLIVTLIAVRWIQKSVLIFLLILSAVTSYYQDTLGATIDREMIQNAMTTTVTESKHLITVSFLIHVLMFGILPSLAVLWVRIRPQTFLRGVLIWSTTAMLSAAICAGLLLTNFKAFSVVLRANKQLMASYQPGAPLSATLRYTSMMLKSGTIVVQPLGTDAKMVKPHDKPMLVVIVAGETARSKNWSLSGYARDTNPELGKRDIVYFRDTQSCGTATATSLPCMFSHLTRTQYSYEKGLGSENLLDVMAHAGYAVEWWDNNTGDKQIAARFPETTISVIKSTDPEFCANGECTDGIFLQKVKDYAANLKQDTVLVLHTIGSHGPSYYLRYPDAFKRFTPACETAEIKNCTTEEITNAYDNTILYTDHIVASLIDILDADQDIIPSLFYVSDHGESLGENGLYLHGAPYFMAPDEQKDVPMLIWLPDRASAVTGITTDCLRAVADKPYSHDNMFQTMLSLGGVQTDASDQSLDITANCHDQTN